jgi:SAM-dependent methyltransferase
MNVRPEVDFGDTSVPFHLTAELRSYLPKARSSDSLLLDLGCGNAVHKAVCERAGFEWVGADYDETSEASVLADAHSLPFKDGAFECVLSVAAIQLFQYPFVAMKEVHRVLKPGGIFIGTVAFLEPAAGGFYHHTDRGVLNSLEFPGFTVNVLAPSEEWSMLVAQAQMGLFPKMPGVMSRGIVYPLQLLHKLWWAAGRLVTGNPNADNSVRIRNTTGAFAFVASRSESIRE